MLLNGQTISGTFDSCQKINFCSMKHYYILQLLRGLPEQKNTIDQEVESVLT